MLSRLCGLSSNSLPYSTRNFSFNLPKLSRYTREYLRDRLYRQKETLKNNATKSENVVHQPDSIPVRPARHLLTAVGFTITSGFVFYYTAAYTEVKRAFDERRRRFDPQNIFADFKKFLSNNDDVIDTIKIENPRNFFEQLSPAKQCILTIIAVNLAITLAWRYKPAEPLMWRYFTNSFASKSMCAPMFLSVFSHKTFLHLGLNMYVLWNFAPVTIKQFLGVEQFLAFYATSGVVSSLLSLAHKCAVASPVRALGASGAILSVLVYACMKMPDARLSIIFLPMFSFSAENAVYGIILFDLAGLLFGFRIFDHAAHLGGALFGLFYAMYGEEFYRKQFRPLLMKAFSEAEKRKAKQD